jgi:hypothetical protein
LTFPFPFTLAHTHTTRTVQKADEALGIPQIVEAGDLVLTSTPDELSVLTYVGYFRAWSDSDPYRCMVMGRGIEAPTLGEPNQFQVSIYGTVNKEPLALKDDQMKVPIIPSLTHARHRTARTDRFCKQELEIAVTGDDGKSLPVKVANNHDGTYTVEYTPTTPGDYEVGVKLYKKYYNAPYRTHTARLSPRQLTARGRDGLMSGWSRATVASSCAVTPRSRSAPLTALPTARASPPPRRCSRPTSRSPVRARTYPRPSGEARLILT